MENMSEKLLDIQPSELKFAFELKKQSSCTVHLANNTDHYVAFKVKATSPKRYFVRPNTSVIQPNSTCGLSFIMEAQQVAPADLKCKDKFLIQSTILSSGTTEEQNTASLFSNGSGRYIHESKLRVVLISPSHSPVSLTEALKQVSDCEAPMLLDPPTNGVKNLSPPLMVIEDLKLLNAMELKLDQDVEDGKVTESEKEFNLIKDVKELKLKMEKIESKLNEAMEKTEGRKEVQLGFSFLYVCLVALMALVLGNRLFP